jgi:CHASE2 domain
MTFRPLLTVGVVLDGWRALRNSIQRLIAKHSRRYWLGAVAVLIGCNLASPYVDDALGLVHARYWLFQELSQLQWRPLIPRFVKVVLVNDDEHWGSELEGIVPIKRDYLARLVDQLAADNASVIALDFDVRLTGANATGTRGAFDEISADTRDAVKIFIHAIIRAAAEGHKIVLSKTIAFDKDGNYKLVADIYQPFGLCSDLIGDGRWENPGVPDFQISAIASKNIRCGYIALPYDMRLLPPKLALDNGKSIDSFSLAIAKAVNPAVADAVGADAYYGSYIPPSTIEKYKIVVSAHDLRTNDPGTADIVSGNAVIVGARWHVKAYGVGDIVDVHDTPIGPIEGAIIHENFAEAILDSRVFAYVPQWLLRLTEFAFSAAAAIAFAVYSKLSAKLAILGCLLVVLVMMQWLMLQVFGTFFEAFIPLLGLCVHSVVERLFEHN